ncbi:type II toxin-antitoxin system Phd/YefM family antitoxin [Companilactobacillus sp. HBUAS56257]|uniref:type II toxin-antitoxin system Phd/YefM family antitoxin n=1 Tax=Companilactobacillus sp. HBUAS56257 TaxID=3109360 RepID=UPI002FEF830A
MKKIYSPSDAQKNLFKIMKEVNSEKKPITISSTSDKTNDVVVIEKSNWDAIQERLLSKDISKDDTTEDFWKTWNEI